MELSSRLLQIKTIVKRLESFVVFLFDLAGFLSQFLFILLRILRSESLLGDDLGSLQITHVDPRVEVLECELVVFSSYFFDVVFL